MKQNQGSAPGTQQSSVPVPPNDIEGLTPYQIPWQWYALIVGIVIFSVYLLIKFKKKYLDAKYSTDNTVNNLPIDPEKRILSAFAKLAPEEPFDLKAREDFYFQLSMLLREMIELKSVIKATDLLTSQIEKLLLEMQIGLAPDEVLKTISFLQKADGIKFAHMPSGIVEADRDKNFVEGILRTLLGRMLQ